MRQAQKRRSAVYIDGLNLYYGIMVKGPRSLLWLDMTALARLILKPHQKLAHVKYFTARVSSPDDKRLRQNTFLEALDTLPGLSLHEGYYQEHDQQCHECGHRWKDAEEKVTDVNVAVEMLQDAYLDAFDDAILVSADGDYVPVIKAIRNTFPKKKVIAAFPPDRFSYNLQHHAHEAFHITRTKIKRCLMPPRIKKLDGFELVCPKEYWHKSFGPEPPPTHS